MCIKQPPNMKESKRETVCLLLTQIHWEEALDVILNRNNTLYHDTKSHICTVMIRSKE